MRVRVFTAAALLLSLVFSSLALSTSSQAAGGDEIWVTVQDSDALAVISGGREIARVALPKGAAPHTIVASASGRFGYVAGMGKGDVYVVDLPARRLVQTLDLGPESTHEAEPSPDGTVVLAAQQATKKLVWVSVDEGTGTWRRSGDLELAKEPICTAFRADGKRAYVSLKPSGVAIVDVANKRVLSTLPTKGSAACGVVNAPDGSILIDSNGGSGHLYRLSTTNHGMQDLGLKLDAMDLHGFDTSASGSVVWMAARNSDAVKVVTLGSRSVANVTLDPRPGVPDQPDIVAVRGSRVYVTMRASGHLATISATRRTVSYLKVAPPSKYAVHGLAVVAPEQQQLPRTGATTPLVLAFLLALAGAVGWRRAQRA